MYSKALLFILLNILFLQLVVCDEGEEGFSEREERDYCERERAIYEKDHYETYDYIVVGVGQGGSVAAARLAEAHSGKYRVLGIEWGGRTHRSLNGTDYVAASWYVDREGKIKVGRPFTRFDVPIYSNTLTTPPTPYPSLTAIFNGNESTVHIGKYLGGSAAHNGQLWLRHSKDTIASWGVEGGSYKDMLPWYKRSEDVSESSTRDNPYYHGFNGPIKISDNPENQYYSAVPLLWQGCVNMGYPNNTDFNGESRYGCGKQVWSIGHGVRSSAAHAYLPQVLKKGNLQLKLFAMATKILIRAGAKGGEPEAYGVEFYQCGEYKRVLVNKEIIVTMSGIFTPKLLMLSGIGEKAHLEAMGIKVWVDNPNVGKHLQSNHVGLGTYNYPNASYGSAMNVGGPANEYALNRTGPYSHPGNYMYGYICSSGKPCSNPDVMIATSVGGFFGNTNSPVKTLSTQVSTATPMDRAIIRLSSNDPFALLNITQDTFGHKQDLEAQVYGWKKIREWMKTYPVSTIITTELVPGPDVETDAQIAAWVKANVTAKWHWVGSAKFGNKGDPTRVVDPQLRVVGVKNIRVGDGSVFPSVNSHVQASVVLAGERVADFILRGQ